ncbi:MAG TPA: hypothetical protein VGE93_24620 [Bryobacteraceae bacterium]
MFSIQTATNQFLSGLSGIEKRLTNDNRQVSSGLRVQTVSDAPDSVSQILQVNAQISASNQVKANLTAVQLEVNVAEGAVNSATTLMDRAVQLATDGASDGTSVDRPQLAAQVQNILVEMQQLTSTQVSGRYVFSGGTDQTPPYGAVDLATNTTNGVGAYTGNNHVKTIGDSYGSQFQISLTAQDVFDGGPSGTPQDSVFQSLTQLYNALSASDPAATQVAAANIRAAANYLNQQQAIYGDFQQRISDALVSQGVLDTNLRAELSNLQDADMPRAITQQQTDATALTAAQVAYSSFPKKSLFDYIG